MTFFRIIAIELLSVCWHPSLLVRHWCGGNCSVAELQYHRLEYPTYSEALDHSIDHDLELHSQQESFGIHPGECKKLNNLNITLSNDILLSLDRLLWC